MKQKTTKSQPRQKQRVYTEEIRAYDVERRREKTAKGQDIGELPPIVNPERRAQAEASFKYFCETYLKSVFYMGWSKDHLRVIGKVEQVVINHDTLAVAMPRGSGKTQLCHAALLWGILTGRHHFGLFVGATVGASKRAIEWFKAILSETELLLKDWPEVCFPIAELKNETRKCVGQRYHGERTKIGWGTDRIIIPTIPGSKASGAVISATSLEGNIRGAWIRMPGGKIIRPTLAICDDPQTSESARSQGPDGQTTTRLRVINEDVQGLAGPDSQTGILVPCTVIQRGDLSDQLLNRRKYPDYRGERTKRLYSWPKNKELWEEYRELREDALRNDLPLDESFTFYRERMAKCGLRMDEQRPCETCQHAAKCMDCAAVVDWQERLDDPRNLSAVQATMHALYKYGEHGFAAEMQNEPMKSELASRLPTADEIAKKANGYDRGVVADKAVFLTAGIDVGVDYLAWLVLCCSKNFTAGVVDYGTWPNQGRTFSKSNPNRTLAQEYPGKAPEGAIIAGLKDLAENLLNRQFPQAGGPPMQLNLCLVDTGYKTDTVHTAIRLVGRNSVLRPSRGVGITAGKTQFDDYKRDRCREMGQHWWISKDSDKAVISIDTNYWKTFIHSRLATAIGDSGSLTLFGRPQDHGLLAHHILAEYYTTPKTEKEVEIQEWHEHVGRDNEYFDCLVMAMVAASRMGCSVIPVVKTTVPKPRRPHEVNVNSSFRPELG